jgi:hypothetical protein
MSAPTPSKNRLAKPLPDQWRQWLIEQGVPKRKYTAVCRATLSGGRVIDELVIDQGWIISLDRTGISGPVTQRIDFDPRTIERLELTQFV